MQTVGSLIIVAKCIPWQYVQEVFQTTQKAVTWDHFQRMLLGSLVWGGRYSSLAPQPKKEFSYIHVMLCASIEVLFKI